MMADTDPWAVVKSEPLPTRDEWAEVKAAPVAPDTNVAEDLINGAVKGIGNTVVGLGELVHKIPGVSAAIDKFYGVPGLSEKAFPMARAAVEPSNMGESVGKMGEQTAEFFTPTGVAGKLGKAAEAIKAAGLTLTQTGSPTAGVVAGALTGAAGPLAGKASDLLESSANKSMIRALGPAGGRGPTGAVNLAKAEEIAPDLVKQGFRPLTQEAARTEAKAAVNEAGSLLKKALFRQGNAPFDQPALLGKIQQARAALKVPTATGQGMLPARTAAQDALLGELESDVARLGASPTAEVVHTLKSRWNDVVNWNADDPASGTLTAVYRKGGNLIRAMLAKDHDEISQADQAFHKASTLNTVLNAATTRRPGPSTGAQLLMPLARPAAGAALGAGVGYKEGGAEGAVAGAVTGAALGRLINAPGFQYMSSAMKKKLADALDAGDSKTIGTLVAAMTSQAANLGRAYGVNR